MSSGIGTPSACERSLTVTPDSTVIGPVGGGAGPGEAGAARRATVAGLRPDCAPPPPSMTTRRFRPPGPPRGESGDWVCRPSAISDQSRAGKLRLLSLVPFSGTSSASAAPSSTATAPASARTSSAACLTVDCDFLDDRNGLRLVDESPDAPARRSSATRGARRSGSACRSRAPRRSGRKLLAVLAAAEGRLGLGLRELLLGLDVDLPAGQARREPGVQALPCRSRARAGRSAR